MPSPRTDTIVWYKQGWPWLLIFFPASAVIAGFFTLYLAIVSDDGMVVDDYYEEGKAINQVIQRDKRATHLNIHASMNMDGLNQQLNLRLNRIETAQPDSLSLKFIHSTRSGIDQEVTLMRSPEGLYTAKTPALEKGRWNLQLANTDWRVMSSLMIPGPRDIIFKADK